MKYKLLADCNRCDNRKCRLVCGIVKENGKRVKRTGMKYPQKHCKAHVEPSGGWQVAELALAYPQNLHNALTALPFKANLNFRLKGR